MKETKYMDPAGQVSFSRAFKSGKTQGPIGSAVVVYSKGCGFK